MVFTPAQGHDGLQVVPPDARLTQPFHDGIQHVPYSDKQVIRTENGLHVDQNANYPGHHDIYAYEKGAGGAKAVDTPEKRYCGLRRRVFWILFAVLLIVIIAAAVGGGVGGSLSHNSSKDASSGGSSSSSSTATSSTSSASVITVVPSSSATSTSGLSASGTTSSSTRSVSSSAPAATATTITSNGMGAYDCPAENATTYISSLYPQTFEILCDSDWPTGVAGIDGGEVVDLNTGVIATSIQACIDQCAANSAGGGECTAVAYGANITSALSRGGITGNCFMKSQRGAQTLHDDSGQAMAAYLVSG